MTPKQKSIFELISKYTSSRGCEYLEMDIDPWNFTPYNGRDFGCGTERHENPQKLPFDIGDIITEYVGENASDFDQDNLSGLSFRLYPQTRTVTITGTYQEIVDGPSTTNEKSEEDDDENLKEIMDFLKKEDIFPFAEVEFSGGGDSGYIDDTLHVDAGSKPQRTVDSVPGLSDYLYEMLGEYGGWEIDEGSFGNFMIDSRAGTITLNFTYNEYAYENVVFNQEEF
jgi:hypothetical protein